MPGFRVGEDGNGSAVEAAATSPRSVSRARTRVAYHVLPDDALQALATDCIGMEE